MGDRKYCDECIHFHSASNNDRVKMDPMDVGSISVRCVLSHRIKWKLPQTADPQSESWGPHRSDRACNDHKEKD